MQNSGCDHPKNLGTGKYLNFVVPKVIGLSTLPDLRSCAIYAIVYRKTMPTIH